MASPTVAVVGLGAYGAATAYQLAKRGANVIGLDQFSPPHAFGSSTGETRITRFAVLEGEDYVLAATRSVEIFSELQTRRGERLFQRNGFTLIADEASAQSVVHGERSVLDRTIALARKFAIPHEVYERGSLAKKFPGFALREDETAYYEPGSGTLFPEACIAAQLDEARNLGADIRTNTRVIAIDPDGQGVKIRTDGGELRADRVVVAAGAWVRRFVPESLRPKFRITRQVLFWFEHENPTRFSAADHPNFIWPHRDAAGEGTFFYGFPCQIGDTAMKIATEHPDIIDDPDELSPPASDAEAARMFEIHARGRFPGVTSRLSRAATCRYTNTPKAKSLIAQHPEMPQVTMVSSCSGHGFKLSAAMGEAIAEQILGERPAHVDLDRFGWDTL
jgi:sarcosine oxidase